MTEKCVRPCRIDFEGLQALVYLARLCWPSWQPFAVAGLQSPAVTCWQSLACSERQMRVWRRGSMWWSSAFEEFELKSETGWTLRTLTTCSNRSSGENTCRCLIRRLSNHRTVLNTAKASNIFDHLLSLAKLKVSNGFNAIVCGKPPCLLQTKAHRLSETLAARYELRRTLLRTPLRTLFKHFEHL